MNTDHKYATFDAAVSAMDALYKAQARRRVPLVLWQAGERFILRSIFKGFAELEAGSVPVATVGCLNASTRRLREELFSRHGLQKREECAIVTSTKGNR